MKTAPHGRKRPGRAAGKRFCAVYCLVPRIDDLDPLLDRLKAAGVAPRDICVVLRGNPLPPADPWAETWWPLIWPLAVYGWMTGSAATRVPSPPEERERVVSLAQYRARMGA